MGAGRYPEPKEDLIARGSRTRNALRDEVVPTGGRPKLPPHLRKEKKIVAIHRELCNCIDAMGILSKDDALSLENAACNLYKLRELQLKSLGMPPDEAAAVEVLVDKYERRLQAFQDRFAMSPASRVRVRVNKASKGKTDLDKFLANGEA